jgi:hypothetical protein
MFFMIVPFVRTQKLDIDPHHYRIYDVIDADDVSWLEVLAREYIKILTHQAISPAKRTKASDDTVMDMSRVQRYRRKACLPTFKEGNFNVVRSDFGELLCYMILERDYQTRFGVKSIYDRELRDASGRGIDAIGVEKGERLTPVFCEVKVSDDKPSPPRVVDQNDDCLSKQHCYHLDKLEVVS